MQSQPRVAAVVGIEQRQALLCGAAPADAAGEAAGGCQEDALLCLFAQKKTPSSPALPSLLPCQNGII